MTTKKKLKELDFFFDNFNNFELTSEDEREGYLINYFQYVDIYNFKRKHRKEVINMLYCVYKDKIKKLHEEKG